MTSSVASLMTSELMQKIYEWTVVSFPGAMYLFSAGTEFLSLILISVLFWFVNRHEKIYGPVGEHQDKNQNNDTT